MTTTPAPLPAMASAHPASPRLDYLDATRAFALVLGVVFHASLSFLPFYIGWAVQDVSTNIVTGGFATISHSFRLEVFFLLAGFFTPSDPAAKRGHRLAQIPGYPDRHSFRGRVVSAPAADHLGMDHGLLQHARGTAVLVGDRRRV